MKDLWKYLAPYKKESILGPLFKLLEASFELFVPLVMAAIIDRGIATQDTGYILRMGLILVVLAIIGLTCALTAQYFAAKASVGFATGIKSALFAHIQTLSYTELDTLGTDTLITRMTSDMNQVQNGMNLTLRLLLRSPFVVFGAVIMAFSINVRAALIFAVAVPLLCVVVFGIMLWTMPLYKKVQASLDRVLGLTRENLTGARVLRAFRMERAEEERFRAQNEELTARQLFVGRISAMMNPVTFIIINVATVILLWSGAIRIDNGILSQGEVIALVNYMSQILVELVKMANLIINITKALACADRVSSVMKIETTMKPVEQSMVPVAKGDENAPVLEMRNVGLTYAGAGESSLDHLNLKVQKGQTVGIIGGTGSGKSSLVNLIPRYYDATEGEVLLAGRNIKEYLLDEVRDLVGMVPQKAVLFTGTIRDNLLFGRDKDASEVSDEDLNVALETAQAKDFVDSRPNGLDDLLTQGGKNLSGGQKQRLTIARALVRKPKILILDDSASALDFATDARLRQAIRHLDPEMTVFIVSQRTASVRFADQIIVLEDGQIAGTGTHEELLENCEVYQEIYYSQFPKQEGGQA
ncbi:MAG: ABC transporter ATP-binding protein/permease [Cuneatibacter sp.]|nr:ABC transporter ATP-binding protein/permease [Cuneatibacter sp.]